MGSLEFRRRNLRRQGEVPFNYSMLTPLKESISPDPVPELELSEKVKMISASYEYDIDIIGLLAVLGSYSERAAWQEGVKKVEQVTDKIPQLGTRHRCVMDKGSVIVHYSNFSYVLKRLLSVKQRKQKQQYLLHIGKSRTAKTKLTIDYYITQNPLQQIIFNLTENKKFFDKFRKSLMNLEKHIKPGRLPDNRIPNPIF